MKITPVLLMGILITTVAMAEDQPLGKPFGVATGTVVKMCEQQQVSTLLLRVLPDGRGLSGEEAGDTLAAIETQLQVALSAENRVVKVLEHAAEEFAKGVLTPEQARQLLQTEQATALLTADYLEKKSASSLRLAFFTEEGMQWVKRVRLDQPKQEQPQVAANPLNGMPNLQNPLNNNQNAFTNPNALNQLAAAQNLAANGLGNGAPATMSGSSGYQFTRNAARGEEECEKDEEEDDEEERTEDDGENTPAASGLNEKVLQFALDHLGEKVGNGQCWTLANEALIAAGAQPARGYTFGEEIGVEDLSPGDILQFKRARFDYGNSYALMGMPDHTAIVKSVNGNTVTVLHQNFGQKIVTELTINFQNMTTGQVWAYRPVPAGNR